MGSGLILLVIVGAWLAVLVPMALRASGGGTSRTAERFQDAVRVLSPRSSRGVERPPVFEPLLHRVRRAEPRPPLSLVARRRRVLLTLLGSAVACLLGGLLSGVLLGLGVVLLVLTAVYVVHLRRLAVAREQELLRDEWDSWDAQELDDAARAREPLVVEGVPDRMPERTPPPAPVRVAAPAVARYADVAAAVGAEWTPSPVPPPLYVGQPTAPARAPRTLDLSMDGAYATVSAGELGTEPDLELDQILDGRRVAGGW